MERIDLLWDAWEDCLCKEQLRTEFDRLKSEVQERDRLAQKLVQEVDRYINIAYDYKTERDEAQAENEKIEASRQQYIKILDDTMTEAEGLTAENERLKVSHRELEDCLGDSGRRAKSLQSHLDKISEPYHYSRDKAEYPWIRHEDKADGCPICNPAPHIYVDSHGEEWSHSGLEKDCPICRLKPLSEKLP